MRLFKHAVHNQKDHGNRGGKRSTSDYERLRRKFKAKRTRDKNADSTTEFKNSDLTNSFLRRAYRKYVPNSTDGVGTSERKNNQRKYAQRLAAYRRGTRKTDPTATFEKLLDKQDIKSVRISIDGAIARGAKGRSLPSKKDVIPDPDSFSSTVGARGYTDHKIRQVKPTGRVKRTGK